MFAGESFLKTLEKFHKALVLFVDELLFKPQHSIGTHRHSDGSGWLVKRKK